jgi:hypothetical protein
MTPPAPEIDEPLSPNLRARYPSMTPTGRVADRVVPRYPPAEPAAPAAEPRAAETEADRALRRRYPTMFKDELAPAAATAEQPASAPGAAAAEREAAAPDTAPVGIPPEYQGLSVPEDFALDERAFGPVAAKMREVGFTREQAETALALHAEQVQRSDAALVAEQRRWRAEGEKLLATPEAKQALSAAMRSAPREVVDLLDRSGLGDHPGLVRWVLDLGRRLGGVAAPADPRNRYPRTRWDQ